MVQSIDYPEEMERLRARIEVLEDALRNLVNSAKMMDHNEAWHKAVTILNQQTQDASK